MTIPSRTLFAAWTLAVVTTTFLVSASAQTKTPTPPVADKKPFVVKSPQGNRVDEYYWLRDDDPKQKRPEVMAYLEAENAYTAARMAPVQALQAKLVAEMRSRIREDDDSVPTFERGWWYWTRFETGAEYPLLLRQRGTPERMDPDARPEVLLDQPAMAKGQAFFAVGATAVSPDGQWLAWVEDRAGRRINTLRIKNLATGEVLPDVFTGALEALAWANDNKTLFYIRQDPVLLQSGPIWRHVRGTSSADDRLVYDEKDKTQFVSVARSTSGRYLVIRVGGFDTSETLVVDADEPTAAPRVVLARKAGVRHEADHLHGQWVIKTNERAINFRLVSAPDSAADDRRRWRTLLPGRRDAALENFSLFEAGIAYEERVKADTRVRWIAQGQTAAAARSVFEAPATTVSLVPTRDPRAAHVRYGVTSLVTPQSTFDHHIGSARNELRKQRAVPGYDASQYETRRVWVRARDGAQVPVSLAWRRDRARADGSAPLYIEAYGAYGSSYSPAFSNPRVSLLDRGFVYALAHVRGGADLGQAWYEAGRLMNKRNTFNDFIDVTDGLLAQGWGARDKVFASGGSAGGLLMGAVANMAGMKYRAMALHVPFVDVMTTMLDETIPLTVNEWAQWGDPRQKKAYAYMLSYSPYDNLQAKPYPAMLVTAGLWDSQVQYYEPAKYVARLRALTRNDTPLLLYMNLQAGHGGQSGRFEALNDVAREFAFFLGQLGINE